MKICAFLNEKGGVGKSSLCISLAAALYRTGHRVVIVDTDPQGTARDWRAAAPERDDLPPVVALDRPEIFAQSIKTLAADIALIDTPAKAEKMAATVVRLADLALLPVQPSAADVWASAAAVKLIRAKLDIGGQINAAFVATRVLGNSRIGREIRAGQWNEYGIPLLETWISNRVSYAESLGDGGTVFDTADSAAKAEIESLIRELESKEWL